MVATKASVGELTSYGVARSTENARHFYMLAMVQTGL